MTTSAPCVQATLCLPAPVGTVKLLFHVSREDITSEISTVWLYIGMLHGVIEYVFTFLHVFVTIMAHILDISFIAHPVSDDWFRYHEARAQLLP